MTGSSITLLSNLEKLLSEVSAFDNYNSARQAAFRARVTRYMSIAKETGDTDTLAILEDIQSLVGKAAKPKAKVMTLDEKADAYKAEVADYASLDNKRRAAFRAKLTRLMNDADEAGRDDLINSLNQIYLTTETVQRDEIRARIKAEADKLRKSLAKKGTKTG